MLVLAIIAIVFGLLLAVSAYSYWVEPFCLRLTSVKVEILEPGSPFEGFKILHLSDFHLRKETNPRLTEMFRSMVQRLSDDGIDLICMTGDLIETDTGLPLLEEIINHLQGVGAAEGMVAILGNHDYNHYHVSNVILEKYVVRDKNDTRRVIELLSGAGVVVLRNQTYALKRNGQRLVFIGIDDFISGRHCIQFCFENVQEHDKVVFLTHSPDVVSYILDRPVDLVLAGHTHGGQLRLPVVGSLISRSRVFKGVTSGLFKVGKMFVFITKGVGIVRVAPFRFGCAPEFALLELCAKGEAAHEAGRVSP